MFCEMKLALWNSFKDKLYLVANTIYRQYMYLAFVQIVIHISLGMCIS